MVFLNIVILVAMFVMASWGSGKLLSLYGYSLPVKFSTHKDWLIFAMKIVLFMILVIFQLIILILIGFDPLVIQ